LLIGQRHFTGARHSGVIALFQEHFVKTGLISTEVARALPRAFEKRQTSDYGDLSEPTSKEVLSLRDQVQVFVTACEMRGARFELVPTN